MLDREAHILSLTGKYSRWGHGRSRLNPKRVELTQEAGPRAAQTVQLRLVGWRESLEGVVDLAHEVQLPPGGMARLKNTEDASWYRHT